MMNIAHPSVCFFIAVFSIGLQKADSGMGFVTCRQRCGQAVLIITIFQDFKNTADNQLLAPNKLCGLIGLGRH